MWSQPANRPALTSVVVRAAAWADPVEVASAFADETYACVLLSGAEGWSYVLPAQLEATAPQVRGGDWPDLTLLRYPALLAPIAAACSGPAWTGRLRRAS